MGCRLPGGIESPDQFWQLLTEGREAIAEIPSDRWDLQLHHDADPRLPLHQHVRRAGLVDGICLLYTSPSPRDLSTSRMPSSA